MNDLISRQAAIAYAISGYTREIDGENWIRVSEVRESIKALPGAQPTTIDDGDRIKIINEIRYWMDLCKSYERTIVKLSVALAEREERKEE